MVVEERVHGGGFGPFFRHRAAFRGSLLAAVAAAGLAGCTIDDALTPPADVASVGSINPSISGQRQALVQTEPETVPADAASPVNNRSATPSIGASGSDDFSTMGPAALQAALGPASSPVPDASPDVSARPVSAAPEPARTASLVRPVSPAAPPKQSVRRDVMPTGESACRKQLDRLGVTYSEVRPIDGHGSCGIAHPIKVTALSGNIALKPAATLNCPVTAAFAEWVKDEAAPAARLRYFSGIKSITQLSAYSCRTMNSQKGAPLSEHAHGNAIDIGKLTLNSGRDVPVRKPGLFAFRQRGFLNTVRAESCGYFKTVLGPGSNKYHWNHFHFDLRQRKNGKSYCE